MNPLELSESFIKMLEKNKEGKHILNELKKVAPKDGSFEQAIKQLNLIDKTFSEFVKNNYSAEDKRVINLQWEEMKKARDLMKYGFEDFRSVFASIILASSAIVRNDINLRADLDESIYRAKNDYKSFSESRYQLPADYTPSDALSARATAEGLRSGFYRLSVEDPSRVIEINEGIIVQLLKSNRSLKGLDRLKSLVNQEYYSSQFVDFLVAIYEEFNIDPEGIIGSKVKEILEDQSIILRVGKDLSTLNINNMQSSWQRVTRIDDVVGNGGTNANTGNTQELISSCAPSSIQLRAKDFECIRPQHDDPDDIFWVGYCVKLKNLEEIYEIIDTAIQNDRDVPRFTPVWEIIPWKSNLFRGVEKDDIKDFNNDLIANVEVKNGFSPWVLSLTCFEDDNHQYEAVSEVFDSVASVAQSVSSTAGKIGEVTGPTVVGAAAACVWVGAAAVAQAAGAIGGFIKILNLFDQDDTIGTITFSGQGDYIDEPADQEFHSHSDSTGQSEELGGSNYYSYGYRITIKEQTIGQSCFQRTWRLQKYHVNGNLIEKNPGGFWGGSGELYEELFFPVNIDIFLGGGISPPKKIGGGGHAEWIEIHFIAPRGVVGFIHWGTSWDNTFKFRPWVEGYKILNVR